MSKSLFESEPHSNHYHNEMKVEDDDLLEPIQEDDKQTIQRLQSIPHARSYTANGQMESDEDLYISERLQILDSIDMLFPEKDSNLSDDSSPLNLDRNKYTKSTINTINTFSDDTKTEEEDHNDDVVNQLITTSLATKTATTESTRVIPLQSVQRPRKIERQKTPHPPKSQHHQQNLILNGQIYIEREVNDPSEFEAISGILEKQSASKFRGFQSRWFYLWNETLTYFKENSLPVRGSIDLRYVQYCGITDHSEMDSNSKSRRGRRKSKSNKVHKFTFQIVMHDVVDIANAGRTYLIRTEDKLVRDKWIDTINHNLSILQHTKPMNMGTPRLELESNPNRRRILRSRSIDIPSSSMRKRIGRSSSRHSRSRSISFSDGEPVESEHATISYLDMLQSANTGDILLFRTKTPTSAVVRAATGGDYDHIGMVIKLTRRRLGVLEALGSGVQMFLWSNFEKYHWNEQYLKISLRKLMIPDDRRYRLREEVTKTLTIFTKTVMKRKYGFNPMQLIRTQSKLSHHDESRSFFCSELVAKALKEAGLLRRDCGSAQYYPSTFQESKGLMLLKGCCFSSEMEVTWTESNNHDVHRSNGCDLHDAMKSTVEVISLKD